MKSENGNTPLSEALKSDVPLVSVLLIFAGADRYVLPAQYSERLKKLEKIVSGLVSGSITDNKGSLKSKTSVFLSYATEYMKNRRFIDSGTIVFLIGVVSFVLGGISVFSVPAYELSYIQKYSLSPQIIKKIFSYDMILYNSGYKTQPGVVVKLIRPKLAYDKHPDFYDHEGTKREVKVVTIDGITRYEVGSIGSAKEVRMNFRMKTNTPSNNIWEDMVVSINCGKGVVVKAKAFRLVMGLKLFFSVFFWENQIELFVENYYNRIAVDTPAGRIESGNSYQPTEDEFMRTDSDIEVSFLYDEVDLISYSYNENPSSRLYAFGIKVFNHGPADARNIDLSFRVPENVELIKTGTRITDQTYYNKGSLPKQISLEADDSYLCKVNRIHPDNSLLVCLLVLIEEPGLIFFEANAECQTADPDMDDNFDEINIELVHHDKLDQYYYTKSDHEKADKSIHDVCGFMSEIRASGSFNTKTNGKRLFRLIKR